jgi:CO/xanthine dehydrogenase FAD-binding subunit
LAPFATTQTVVDLTALDLNRITETADTLSIGGQTTLQMIYESVTLAHLVDNLLLLPSAAHFAAHLGLRNLATLSGTLQSADTSPELHLALLALNAQVIVQGQQQRMIPLADYESSQGELMLAVTFARPAAARASIARVARSPQDAAIVAAVALVTADTATVAVAGASPKPLTFHAAHSDFQSLPDSILAAANPVADYRGSADYRKTMAGVLAARALAEASL